MAAVALCILTLRIDQGAAHGTIRLPSWVIRPPEAADAIGRRLESVHITGPLRTLSQDIAFGIDHALAKIMARYEAVVALGDQAIPPRPD